MGLVWCTWRTFIVSGLGLLCCVDRQESRKVSWEKVSWEITGAGGPSRPQAQVVLPGNTGMKQG
jgi:hypothetical protein